MSTITAIVSHCARELLKADGATFVLREDENCFYVDEDAISPLWKGRRFPLSACISGWCMIHRDVAIIEDIYLDSRIPHDAYRPTFVKSLCVIPIRPNSPIGAIGVYWKNSRTPSKEHVKLLQTLANHTVLALENLELKGSVKRRQHERQALTSKNEELELLMYSMAHDLKNPLTAIFSLGEVAQMNLRAQSVEKTGTLIKSILKTSHRLNH